MKVIVREILEREVEAESINDVMDMYYKDMDLVLDADDLKSVDFLPVIEEKNNLTSEEYAFVQGI